MTRPLTSFKVTVGWGHPKDKPSVLRGLVLEVTRPHPCTPARPTLAGSAWQRATQTPRGRDHQRSSQRLAASCSKKQQVCRWVA